MWKIGAALPRRAPDTMQHRRAHTAPLEGQIRAVTEDTASAAASLTTAVAAIQQAQAAANKVA